MSQKLRAASATENSDLFWGLRGGGGNFGIVTSFEYRLHPVGPVLAGMVVHPMAKAKEVLRFYRDYARTCPDELTAFAALMTSPREPPSLPSSWATSDRLRRENRWSRQSASLDHPLLIRLVRCRMCN